RRFRVEGQDFAGNTARQHHTAHAPLRDPLAQQGGYLCRGRGAPRLGWFDSAYSTAPPHRIARAPSLPYPGNSLRLLRRNGLVRLEMLQVLVDRTIPPPQVLSQTWRNGRVAKEHWLHRRGPVLYGRCSSSSSTCLGLQYSCPSSRGVGLKHGQCPLLLLNSRCLAARCS